MKPILEIACFNYESALIAQQAGADRIELCVDYAAGGLTPDLELFKKVKRDVNIPVCVMIRPRPGSFFYTEEELDRMKQDILLFLKHKVDGFVFGVLNSKNEIDPFINPGLVKLANSTPCTFHRAFDSVPDSLLALEILIASGFNRVLTSGSKTSAYEGMDCLSQLVRQAGDKIIVMPGGGIRSENIELIRRYSDAKEFHTSGIIQNELADFNEIQLLSKSLRQ